MRLLHGSLVAGLSTLKIKENREHPFGSAIYCTADEMVAECYSRRRGEIYSVEVTGPVDLVIDMDKPFYQQSKSVKIATLKARKALGMSLIVCPMGNTRDIVHGGGSKKDEINNILKSHGIWMIQGHLDPMERSGLMDRGVQYAILSESHVNIINRFNGYDKRLYIYDGKGNRVIALESLVHILRPCGINLALFRGDVREATAYLIDHIEQNIVNNPLSCHPESVPELVETILSCTQPLPDIILQQKSAATACEAVEKALLSRRQDHAE